MRTGEKRLTLSSEAKYDIVYKDPAYMQYSVGQKYLTWTLHQLKFNTVLDVGCGVGYALLGFILHRKQTSGIEPCQYLLDTTLRTYHQIGIVKKGRIQQIPYDESMFDLVYCTDVLEHIPECDVDKSISELVRVSKKYVMVTICTVKAAFHPELNLHETVKAEDWWKSRFDKYRLRLANSPYIADDEGRIDKAKGGVVYVYTKY
jgi:ubiquinone/menaquinone biosynthesis C-methylase UbiE